MAEAEKKGAEKVLFAVSFAESSFFPIPPDLFLIPMVLASPSRAWRLATLCTIASILGAIVGYIIGWGFFETIAQPILSFYGKDQAFERFQEIYNRYGWWIVLGAGFTPFPFKVITIASGVTGLNLPLFLLASLLSRAGRFFLVSGLLYKFGGPMRTFIEKYFGLLTVAAFVLLLAGFYAVKYLL